LVEKKRIGRSGRIDRVKAKREKAMKRKENSGENSGKREIGFRVNLEGVLKGNWG